MTMQASFDPVIEKPLSRVAIGCHGLRAPDIMSSVLDRYVEAGGTIFDSAYTYGNGLVDQLLGQWHRRSGIRNKIVIVGKGAQAPCHPDVIAPQLDESLDRLQTDYLDIYFLHRDNPEVPVGEFVDALDREFQRGRIRMFGGSNWTLPRVDEANAYAGKNNRQRFGAISNQFSLAEMIDPVWPGCISSSTADDVAWFKSRGVSLFAWSSQARGFFSDRAAPDKRMDSELERCWCSEENFARRDRAQELAQKHRTTLTRIALAYLLAQTFPIFPIIGPVTTAELDESLGALDVALSPAEADWLRTG